jgi:hypothetical protein
VARLLRRDCLMEEVYLGLCYGRVTSQRSSQPDDTFAAYLACWSEARRG